MIRNFKALGLALVAVFALSAMAASAASAHEFRSEASPTQMTGSQTGKHVFKAGGTVECNTATFSGTVTGTTVDTVTIHPTYGGCLIGGFIEAPVDTNGCNYEFDSETDANGHAEVDIECTAGNNIVVTGAGCTITVNSANNQNLKGVSYTNTGAGTTRSVDVKATVTGIHFSASGGFCGLAGVPTGTHTTGTYTGDTLVTGESDPGTTHRGIWVE